jgi:ribonuclease BN (tRNA processing enzyme)
MTVLGSSGMFATVERAASGYLLELGDRTIWMDAGGGTWRNLLTRLDYRALDGIFLSHRHPDHTIDLFMGYHARMYGSPDPLLPIPLWAPEQTVATLLRYDEGLSESFEMHAVAEGDSIDVGSNRLSFVRMAHPPETLGVRVESDGAVLAYSADTGADADFDSLAGGADLFICESTLQNSDEIWFGHLRASQAGGIASDLGLKRMLITHLPPNRDLDLSLVEARATSGDCEVQLALDGTTVEVS